MGATARVARNLPEHVGLSIYHRTYKEGRAVSFPLRPFLISYTLKLARPFSRHTAGSKVCSFIGSTILGAGYVVLLLILRSIN